MSKTLSQARVFALKGFTIKSDHGQFFASPTGYADWSGPYKSLYHATMAIAREFTERNARLQQRQEPRHG